MPKEVKLDAVKTLQIKEKNLAIDNPTLAAEWHPEKNGGKTPSEYKPRSNKKVWWKCSKGHEWEQSINHRSLHQKCPMCRVTEV